MSSQNLIRVRKNPSSLSCRFQDHLHTPYVVILYKFLQVWRSLHQSEMPKNFKEKLAFKDLIRSGGLASSVVGSVASLFKQHNDATKIFLLHVLVAQML